jgi:hypothetical protein
MKEKIHPKGCIQDEEKVRFWTLLDGGIFISQWLEGKWIGWIFLSNSLVHWAKDITNLWRFGKKNFLHLHWLRKRIAMRRVLCEVPPLSYSCFCLGKWLMI